MTSLQRSEAEARSADLTLHEYDVTLDLTTSPTTFASTTVLRFASRDTTTFLDLKPESIGSITLDDVDLPVDALADGRYPLRLGAGEHVLRVAATMAYRNDGEGLHRSVDPADGRPYVYAMSFMDAAPSVFACFDQPDLKAAYTLHVTAPDDWTVAANGAGKQTGPGAWEFERTLPLSTYFVTLVAGPYHVVRAEHVDDHGSMPLRLMCRQSLADALDAAAGELFGITRAAFDEYHRLLGIRYPFGKYDQVFVPEFNAGAMENPGCVTYRDPLLSTSAHTRDWQITRACYMTHEMAHQWFGNIVTPQWWDDLWLNESMAEYAGNRVATVATPYADAATWSSLGRKNWGLAADTRPSTHPVAGNGATDALGALQDFDGISYAKGAAVLGQLCELIGDDAFWAGVRAHVSGHRFGNATMADLLREWERAGGRSLRDWAAGWLHEAGPDAFAVDRADGTIRRTPPAGSRAVRRHRFDVAHWDGDSWQTTPIEPDAERTPLPAPAGVPVVLDAGDVDWVDLGFDELTLAALPELLPRTTDPALRTLIWNTMRQAVHQTTIDPSAALDVVCAGIPAEDLEVAVENVGTWTRRLLAVLPDRERAARRLYEAFAERARTTSSPTMRLAALQTALATATSVDWLRGLLGGDAPGGVAVDRDLRWRVIKRLTQLGAAEPAFLDAQLELQRDAASVNDWSWCRAALADADAKAWAWQRFTGEVGASNYELDAIGEGMWQDGQDDVLAPYVDRYLAEVADTADLRSGWALASAGQFFFPMTARRRSVVDAANALAARGDVDPGLRRRLRDCADELDRLIRTRERFG